MAQLKKYYVVFLAAILVLQSCTDVVDVDVPNGGNRLVVEASINWEKGTLGNEQIIRLSTSTPYFSKEKSIPVVGAQVVITKNDDEQQIVFIDAKDGNYVTDSFVPQLNQSYTLEITYNGNVYTATETLIPVPEISRVTQSTNEGISKDDTEITIFFDDPKGQKNFYLSVFASSNTSFPELFAIDDRFVDGNEIDLWYEEEELKPGDIVTGSILGISETYYYFINLLIQQQGSGNPFQTPPAQLIGNCKSVTKPNEEVFGYFRLSEVVTIVKEVE